MSDVGGFLKAPLVLDRSQQKAVMEAAQTENWWLDEKFLTRAAIRWKRFVSQWEEILHDVFSKKNCSCFKWLSETLTALIRSVPLWSGLTRSVPTPVWDMMTLMCDTACIQTRKFCLTPPVVVGHAELWLVHFCKGAGLICESSLLGYDFSSRANHIKGAGLIVTLKRWGLCIHQYYSFVIDSFC